MGYDNYDAYRRTVADRARSGAGSFGGRSRRGADGGQNWTALDNNAGLSVSLNVAGLAVDATQSQPTLYAATLGRGMHDLEVVPLGGAPTILLQSPASPYPFETTTTPVPVSATGLSTTKMIWSTNRGHAGVFPPPSGTTFTASVLLESGLNLITLTAVDASSTEASTSLTVNLAESGQVIFVSPLTVPSFGTVPVGSVSAAQNVTVQNTGTANLILGVLAVSNRLSRRRTCAPASRSRRRRRARWGSNSSRRALGRRMAP